MTDAPSAADPELITLRKQEWEDYQRYVKGLETTIAGHEAAEKHRAEKEAAEAKRAEARAAAVAAVTMAEEETPVYRSGGGGRTAMFVIGWILFSLGVGIPTVMQALSIPVTLGIVTQGHLWVGIIVGVLFLLSIISLFMQIGFQRADRPLAVLLNGILAPIVLFALTVAILIFTSFAISSSIADGMEAGGPGTAPGITEPAPGAEGSDTVTLRVTGTGEQATSEVGLLDGEPGPATTIPLPYEEDSVLPQGTELSAHAVFTLDGEGDIMCEWLINGEPVVANSASGAGASVTCDLTHMND